MDVNMEEFAGSSEQAMIVKGRRTKRTRQSSLVTSSNDGGEEGEGSRGEINSLINPSSNISICNSDEISSSMEEDEDMAYCLILLAQSGCSSSSSSSSKQVHHEGEFKNMEKISSRKFTEMATTTNIGKVGIYVYECKTCNRTFPSFQALGGHRASHKKPKQIVDEKRLQGFIAAPEIYQFTTESPCQQKTAPSHDHEEKTQKQIANNKNTSHGSINKSKIHECSICGLEFSSGQALGGHMRRHRTTTTTTQITTITTTTSSKLTTSNDTITNESSQDGEKPRNILQLDLNLPAPIEDQDVHLHDSKFKKIHLFSSPALVDCHY